MKISAIQSALQELGFLNPGHPADGNWDALTNAGYIQAAKKGNLAPALWRQPSYIDQLPAAVRALVERPKQAEQHKPQDNAAKIAADAKARAEAEAKRVAEQTAAAEAAARAAASAKPVDIAKAVAADAKALDTDAGVNSPDGAAADGQKPADNATNTAAKPVKQ